MNILRRNMLLSVRSAMRFRFDGYRPERITPAQAVEEQMAVSYSVRRCRPVSHGLLGSCFSMRQGRRTTRSSDRQNSESPLTPFGNQRASVGVKIRAA